MLWQAKKLDDSWTSEEGNLESIRYRGIAVAVDIKYSNLKPWTLIYPDEPEYTITVNAMPASSFKHADVVGETKTHRGMRLSYGIMVIMTQTGSLAVFSPIFALVAFTSALALLAVANTLTELLMLHVLPNKEEYAKLKYKDSKDFHPAGKEADIGAGGVAASSQQAKPQTQGYAAPATQGYAAQ